jgi:hypothetical protein
VVAVAVLDLAAAHGRHEVGGAPLGLPQAVDEQRHRDPGQGHDDERPPPAEGDAQPAAERDADAGADEEHGHLDGEGLAPPLGG